MSVKSVGEHDMVRVVGVVKYELEQWPEVGLRCIADCAVYGAVGWSLAWAVRVVEIVTDHGAIQSSGSRGHRGAGGDPTADRRSNPFGGLGKVLGLRDGELQG